MRTITSRWKLIADSAFSKGSVVASTKKKPNPKDLLKKAYAHKNQDGTNGVKAPMPKEEAKAVFKDIDCANEVAPKAVEVTPVVVGVTPEIAPMAVEVTPVVVGVTPEIVPMAVEVTPVVVGGTPEIAPMAVEVTPVVVGVTPEVDCPVIPDTVDQNVPDFLTDDLPPPDDDLPPPEDDFDPADLLEPEPSAVESEPVVAEPVAEEAKIPDTDVPVVTNQEDNAPVVDNASVYTDEANHSVEELEAPLTTFVDDLIDRAATEDIFNDAPEINLSLGTSDFNDAPPEIPESHFAVEEDEAPHYAEKNIETLSLLDQVKADKEARKREYSESLQKLEAIESERSELEEIMRQQLLKQQNEEAAKLNEGIEKIRTRNRNFLTLLGDLYRRETDAIQADNLVAIAQTFKTDSTITLQSYLLINRYLHRFNIKYDMEEIRVFLSEDLLNIETPPLDFDYYYLWESNLDTKITPYMWDKHKLMVFNRANFTCELCGGVGMNNPVELYPQWRMFDSNRTQILQGFLALCPKCVDAKNHAQLKQRNLKMRYESAREHMKNVNGWDDRQVENALLEAEEVYAKRVDAKAEPERFKKWKLNIQVLENIFGIQVEEPKFHQRSHIKSDYQQIFEPHVAYLFGKIESDRMIKTGKTKFLSIKLDVEPMKKAR